MKNHVKIAAMLSSVAVLALGGAPAHAQAASTQSQVRDFNVPAQPLAQAVLAFSQQAGIQLVLESGTAEGIDSSAIKGRMSVAEALTQLLAGTSLTWHFVNDRTITIDAAPQGAAGERVLGAVRVEGVQGSPYFGGAGRAAGVNGINGSSDITATEGTKSFTSGALTIGSKVPQAMKDVPQSLSVLTQERLQQQNVTDFTTAMKQLPGVTLVQDESTVENTFYSRGFAITDIQVDGGPPFSTNYGFFPEIDMSIYDHVELLRGAAGQFGSYGDPGGTVNLVRKKPLDHAQFLLEAQAGSWSNYRVVADATSPLALDGRLRGRLVMTYQDNHHFYETSKDNKTLIYGITEFDVTPTTLFTVGINYTRQNSVPWLYGLPRYLDGADLELPRSSCLCFGWNRWDFDTTEIFGGVEQKVGEHWVAKFNLTDNRQASVEKAGYSARAVNPTNGLGPQLYGTYNDFESKLLSAEATLSGAFTLFGQRQEVVIGANRAESSGGGTENYDQLVSSYLKPYQPYSGGPIYCADYGLGLCPAGSIPSNPPIDVFNFDPSDPLYTEPPNPLPNTRYSKVGTIQSTAYINLRLTAFDRLHLTTGLHWSRYQNNYAYVSLCTTTIYACAGKKIGEEYYSYSQKYKNEDFGWPPAANLSFDVSNSLTVYAGYTDIYKSQAYYLDANNKPLPPITGSNWEAGVKWAPRNGRLNLSLAAYRVRQKGFAMIDPPDYSGYHEVSPGISCCWVVDPNQIYESKGIDAEATGELRRGWQISASYTYSDNRNVGSYFGMNEGHPFVSIQPKHLYKLWTSYDFGAAGHAGVLSRVVISGGVNGQSSAYRSGHVCVNFGAPPDPFTGAQDCKSFDVPDYVPFEFIVPAYAVLSARIDYRLSDNWSAAVNLENILDKSYYQTVGSDVNSGHWYGPPRSITMSLRAKW